MKSHRTMRCDSCGATKFKLHSTDGVWVCEYCGAMSGTPNKRSSTNPVQSGSQPMRMVVIIVSLFLLIGIVIFNKFYPNNGWFNQQEISEVKEVVAIEPVPEIMTDSSTNDQAMPSSVTEPTRDTNWFKQNLIIDHQVSGTTRSGGKYWIFEIHNQADEDMLRPGVTVSLFDADNKRVAEQGGWSHRQLLKAGETTQTLVFLDEPPQQATSQQVTTMASQSSFLGVNQIALTVTDYTVNEKNGQFEIIGDIHNEHTTEVKYPKVVVVAQNSEGQAIGLGNAFSTEKALSPNTGSGFKVRLGTFLVGKPVTWQVYALAQKP